MGGCTKATRDAGTQKKRRILRTKKDADGNVGIFFSAKKQVNLRM